MAVKIVPFPQDSVIKAKLRAAERHLEKIERMMNGPTETWEQRVAAGAAERLYPHALTSVELAKADVLLLSHDGAMRHKGLVHYAFPSVNGAH